MYHFIENYIKRHSNNECRSSDMHLGKFSSLLDCSDACRQTQGCRFFIYAIGATGTPRHCWWEKTSTAQCPEGWGQTGWDFYEMIGIICKHKYFKFTTSNYIYHLTLFYVTMTLHKFISRQWIC